MAKFIDKSIRELFRFRSNSVPEKIGNTYFYPAGMTFGDETQNLLDDFVEVPEVNAIISILGSMGSNINLEVVSKTTGEPIENDLSKLLKTPNWFQTQKEFLNQTDILSNIYGNEILYKLTPIGLSKAFGLFTIPFNIIKINAGDLQPFWNFHEAPEQLEYKYNWNNKSSTLEKENLVHTNNNNAIITPQNYLNGSSQLTANHLPIQNIRAAYQARGVIIKKHGAVVVMSPRGKDATGSVLPMTPEEKETVQKEYAKYGLQKGQLSTLISTIPLDVQSVNFDVGGLKLFEECQEDTTKLCDAFGFSYDLLSQVKNNSLNSSGGQRRESEKQVYQNAVIPKWTQRVEALNTLFNTVKESYHITGSYTHVAAMQVDLESRSKYLNLLSKALIQLRETGLVKDEELKIELQKFGLII